MNEVNAWVAPAPSSVRLILVTVLFLTAASLPLYFDILTVWGRLILVAIFLAAALALTRYRGFDVLRPRWSGSTACVAVAVGVTSVEFAPAISSVLASLDLGGVLFFLVLPLAFWVGGGWAVVQTYRHQSMQFPVEAAVCLWVALHYFSREFP
jgi:hypothetical protein